VSGTTTKKPREQQHKTKCRQDAWGVRRKQEKKKAEKKGSGVFAMAATQ